MAKKKVDSSILKQLETATKNLEKLNKWLDSLTEHDRNNITTLLRLPTASDLINNLPSGTYKDMMLIALSIKVGLQQRQTHLTDIARGR